MGGIILSREFFLSCHLRTSILSDMRSPYLYMIILHDRVTGTNTLITHDRLTFDLPVHDHPPWQDHWYYSVGNHFFQTLAISPKWRVDWNKYSPKSNRARHIWRVTFFFKLANKYQINNTVMFNNLFSRFWQVINLVKKDQHSLKSCVDLFFLNFVF